MNKVYVLKERSRGDDEVPALETPSIRIFATEALASKRLKERYEEELKKVNPAACEVTECIPEDMPTYAVIEYQADYVMYEWSVEEVEIEGDTTLLAELQTALGKLRVRTSGDNEYFLGFYVELARKKDDAVIDLVGVEVKNEADEDNKKSEVRAYLWGDTTTEEYTKDHTWSENDINVDID